MLQLLYAKQLTQSDAACSKQIKLPKNEARKFAGDLKHRQSITLDVKDTQGRSWIFLCTCYGCQYALSRVGSFAKEYNLKAGDILVFLQHEDGHLIVTVNEHVPSHLSVPIPRANKTPHRRKSFTTRPPTARSPPPDTSSVSSILDPDMPASNLQTTSPRTATKPHFSFEEDPLPQLPAPRNIAHLNSFSHPHQAQSPRSHIMDHHHTAMQTHSTRPPATKRPAEGNLDDDTHFLNPNLMHLIKKVCKGELPPKEEIAAEGSSGPSAVSGGTASGASTDMRVMLPAEDEGNAAETTSRGPQQLQHRRQQHVITTLPCAWQQQQRMPPAQKPAAQSTLHPLFQPTTARVNVLASVSLPVSLSKRLTKMDVACAHDQVGIVLPRDEVSASGILVGVDDDTIMHFVVEDAMGEDGETLPAMSCALTPSGNRKFWYLTGLGPFLKRHLAVHGQVLEMSRTAGGPLLAYLCEEE